MDSQCRHNSHSKPNRIRFEFRFVLLSKLRKDYRTLRWQLHSSRFDYSDENYLVVLLLAIYKQL